MIEAERAAAGDRGKKLDAAHDFFYRGPIASDDRRLSCSKRRVRNPRAT
jgi:hypothetical protein